MNPSVQHDDARFLALLDRWQSGDFTRADERELKVLTDSDEFRREAMEGFMSLPEGDHDAILQALRNKVRLRSGAAAAPVRRIVLLRWSAAAAVLALLISAIWFLPDWSDKEAAPIARVQDQPLGRSESAPEATQPSISEQKDIVSAPATPGIQRATGLPRSGVPGAVEKNKDALEESESPTFSDVAAAPESDDNGRAAGQPAAPPSNTSPQSVFQDKRSEESVSKPVQEVTTGNAPASAAKDMAKAARSKKRTDPIPSKTDSIWHTTDRKPDMEAVKKEAREDAQPQTSEPAGGWDAFNEYLRQNARLTLEARDHNISGTVRLQFSVNANGEPQNFITLRSLGFGCDEEAVRLVKGWDWIHGKSPMVTLDVRFVR